MNKAKHYTWNLNQGNPHKMKSPDQLYAGALDPYHAHQAHPHIYFSYQNSTRTTKRENGNPPINTHKLRINQILFNSHVLTDQFLIMFVILMLPLVAKKIEPNNDDDNNNNNILGLVPMFLLFSK